MRLCTKEDFGNTAGTDQLFDTWKGFILACPDLKDDETLYFEGDQASMYV